MSMTGSSPLTRGKPERRGHHAAQEGLIPAHAGKTHHRQRRHGLPWAHPRSRGENALMGMIYSPEDGSSPLTRGKRGALRGHQPGSRLIPAHAGKTPATGRRSFRLRAHPRSRGENTGDIENAVKDAGSSPLTRGKHSHGHSVAIRWGLIPAHAGKTDRLEVAGQKFKAHPRSRGENSRIRILQGVPSGSSPLTRGKLLPSLGPPVKRGLIPAHAGKTTGRK